MATTISNSERGSSPLLTADVASRAKVYGGRGLVFDGVVDYLTLGSSSIFNHSGNYSISVWIKKIGQPDANVDTNANPTIIAKGNVYFTFFVNHDGMLGAFFYNNSSANDYNIKTADGVISLNVWHHVVLTWDNTSSQLYVDGKQEYSGSYTPYNLNTGVNGAEIRIGDRETPSTDTRWHGNMSDMKIFDSHLTEAQVQELYLKPEQSAPSAVQDNLVVWYPMCEGGKPESPQSIVYDHSEKKLGTEVNTLANALSPTNETNATTGLTSTDNNITSVSDVKYSGNYSIKFETDANAESMYATSNFTVESGKLYKFSVTWKTDSSSHSMKHLIGTNYYNGSYVNIEGVAGSTDWVTSDYYFVTTSTALNFKFAEFVSSPSEIVMYIDSISIKPVLMGNHATTNFFGDELVDTNARTFESTSTYGWAVYGSNTIANDSNTLKITRVDNNQGAYLYLRNATDLSTDLTVGKTYLLKADFLTTDASKTFTARVSNTGGTDVAYNSLNNTSFVTKEFEFVAGHASNAFLVVENMATDGIVKVDNLTLKEVGISSSGFVTADLEPTIPQVPLLRYNKKMVFDGVNDYVEVSSSSEFNLGSNNFSLLLWIYKTVSTGSGEYDGLLFRSANWRVKFQASDQLIFFDNGTRDEQLIDNGSSMLNAWYHIAIVRNGTTLTGYVNGQSKGTITLGSTETFDDGTNNLIIGQNGSGSEFGGLIDETSIFNTVLTESQVKELFNDGVALDATTHSKSGNLLGYWRNDGVTTWQDRRGWSYLNFDSTDYIDCGTAIGNSLGDGYSNDLTVSLWFKLASTGTSRGLFTIGAFAGSGGEVYLAYFGYGALVFRLNDSGWTKSVTGFTNLGWNHMAVVYDASSEANSKLYLNGSSVGGASGTFPSSLDFNGLKTIIGAVESNAWNWEGGMKSVGLYNVTKSEAEIQAIYNAGINSSEVSNSGIINYWELDNASTVTDLVGSSNGTVSGTLVLNDGNTGTVNGTPDSIIVREGLNSNKDGLGFPFKNDDSNVLRLPTVNEYLLIKDSDAFSFGDSQGDLPFSISAWIKMEEATQFVIVSKGVWATNQEYILWINDADKLSLELYDESVSSTYEGAYYNSALNQNEWIHVCATYDGRGGTSANAGIKLYINGDSKTTTTFDGGTYVSMENQGADLHIGKYTTYTGTGIMDELMIYNKELSATEISKNYKHGKGKHKND